MTQPIYILLPVCLEQNDDVFLDILKCTIARSKLNQGALDLKLGMGSEKFSVSPEDLSLNWENHQTDVQKLRQSKLLGFWMVGNFPKLAGKIFWGSFDPPKRSDVVIVGNEQYSGDRIDSAIFEKMKLRIMELHLSWSTLEKLKHFVQVPSTVGMINEKIISKKMKSFDIEDQYIDDCWNALKFGQFVEAENFVNNELDPSSFLEVAIIEDSEMNGDNLLNFETPSMPDENLITPVSGNIVEASTSQSAKRPRLDGSSDNMVLETLQKESERQADVIVGLQKRMEASSELREKSDRELTAAIDALRNDLKSNRTPVVQTNDAQKKLTEENAKLQVDRELNEATIKQLQDQVGGLKKKLTEADLLKTDLHMQISNLQSDRTVTLQHHQILQQELLLLKTNETQVVAEFRTEIGQMEANIREKDKVNAELVAENAKLTEQLNISNKSNSHNEECIIELRNQIEILNKELTEADRRKTDFLDQISNLQTERTASVHRHQTLLDELNFLKTNTSHIVAELRTEIERMEVDITEKDKVNAQLVAENVQLTDRLNVSSQSNSSNQIERNNKTDQPIENEQFSESVVQPPDTIVARCRESLLQCKFGWIKFYKNKNRKYPGFVHPIDGDGNIKAQMVTATGCVGYKKSFIEYHENIAQEEKEEAELAALTKFNKKFKFSFV